MGYFVYTHLKADSGDVFYVGRGRIHRNGTCYRAFSKHPRSPFWRRVVAIHGFSVRLIARFETLEEANIFEKALIRHYGRRILSEGDLVNLSEGGDGATGLPHTEEWNEKIAASLRGRTRPPETVRRMREAFRRREVRARMSAAKRGNTYWLGKTHGEAAREKLRQFHTGLRYPAEVYRRGALARSREIVDTLTGERLKGAEEVARRVGVPRATVYNWLNNRSPNKTTFRYADLV